MNQECAIHIFGAAGSGTSTLGRALAGKNGFFFMDTDDYFWMPTDPKYTIAREPAERVALMRRDMDARRQTVISGALAGWGDALIPLFTLAVRLVTPTDVRLSRLRARELARFGARIEAGGDMYETHQAFLRWASEYDTGGVKMRSRAEHDLWQRKLACPLLTLDGTEPIDVLVARVEATLR